MDPNGDISNMVRECAYSLLAVRMGLKRNQTHYEHTREIIEEYRAQYESEGELLQDIEEHMPELPCKALCREYHSFDCDDHYRITKSQIAALIGNDQTTLDALEEEVLKASSGVVYNSSEAISEITEVRLYLEPA